MPFVLLPSTGTGCIESNARTKQSICSALSDCRFHRAPGDKSITDSPRISIHIVDCALHAARCVSFYLIFTTSLWCMLLVGRLLWQTVELMPLLPQFGNFRLLCPKRAPPGYQSINLTRCQIKSSLCGLNWGMLPSCQIAGRLWRCAIF